MNVKNDWPTKFFGAIVVIVWVIFIATQVPAQELRVPAKRPHKLLDLGQMQVCESGKAEKEICGTWTWDFKAQAFNARSQDGVTATLKVEKIGGGQIVLIRRDLSGPSAGLVARYTAHQTGEEFEGDVPVQLLQGTVTWESHGSTSNGTWRARAHYYLDLGG